MSTSCTLNPGHQVQQPVALANHQLLHAQHPTTLAGSTGYSRLEPVQLAHIKINDAMKTAKDPRNATRPLIYVHTTYVVAVAICEWGRCCTGAMWHVAHTLRRLTSVTKGLWLASMAITTCYYCPAPKSPYVRRVSNTNNNFVKINLSATTTISI